MKHDPLCDISVCLSGFSTMWQSWIKGLAESLLWKLDLRGIAEAARTLNGWMQNWQIITICHTWGIKANQADATVATEEPGRVHVLEDKLLVAIPGDHQHQQEATTSHTDSPGCLSPSGRRMYQVSDSLICGLLLISIILFDHELSKVLWTVLRS